MWLLFRCLNSNGGKPENTEAFYLESETTMFNLDNTNTATLKAFEEGNNFAVLVVLCNKTGGRFVSVRSVSPQAFVTGLKACSRDQNFGAYNSPILESIRKYGVDGHKISLHSVHKTRREANASKKALVERQAISKPETNLNWNRPIKRMPESDFRWLTEEEVAEKVKAKRIRARMSKAAAATETATEASA